MTKCLRTIINWPSPSGLFFTRKLRDKSLKIFWEKNSLGCVFKTLVKGKYGQNISKFLRASIYRDCLEHFSIKLLIFWSNLILSDVLQWNDFSYTRKSQQKNKCWFREDKKIEEKWGKRRKLNTSLVSGQRVFIVEILTHTLENQKSFSKEVLSVSLPLFTNFKNC